jgi:hypothetical protein
MKLGIALGLFFVWLVIGVASYIRMTLQLHELRKRQPVRKPKIILTFTEECFRMLREYPGKPEVIDSPEATITIVYVQALEPPVPYNVQGEGAYLGDLR